MYPFTLSRVRPSDKVPCHMTSFLLKFEETYIYTNPNCPINGTVYVI